MIMRMAVGNDDDHTKMMIAKGWWVIKDCDLNNCIA